MLEVLKVLQARGVLEGLAYGCDLLSAAFLIASEIRERKHRDKLDAVMNHNDTIVSGLEDWEEMIDAPDKDVELIPGSGTTVGETAKIMTGGIKKAASENRKLVVELRSAKRFPLVYVAFAFLILGILLHLGNGALHGTP
jgi:hypothetical protein